MKDVTQHQPKCLVSIGGKTLLEWQIEGLKKAGIQKITLATGYLEEALIKRGYPCVTNPDWSQTNMVATLCCASELLLKEETVVCYSDIAFHHTIISSLLGAETAIAITYDRWWEKLWGLRFQDPLSDAETFKISNSKVKEIGKKTDRQEDIEGQFMGLIKWTPAGWRETCQYLESLPPSRIQQMQMTQLLDDLVNSEVNVEAIAIKGRWCEVDSLEDLALYEQQLNHNQGWDHDWRD